MPVEQTILFTVDPPRHRRRHGPLPVSVFVSPRLRGADQLGAFADWLRWTRRVAETG